jgi:hypothetical protein
MKVIKCGWLANSMVLTGSWYSTIVKNKNYGLQVVKKVSWLIVMVAPVLLLLGPNFAYASLTGDTVTATLVGADIGNGAPTQTAVVGPGIEFMWRDSPTGCPSSIIQDNGVDLDIGDTTISVLLTDLHPPIVICDSTGDSIDDPLTFDITDLNGPSGEVTGISAQPGCPVETTAEVLDSHSVRISVLSQFYPEPALECHFDIVIEQRAVGGEILGIDMTTLVVVGATANAGWIIPVAGVTIAGIIGYIITRRLGIKN